MPHGRLCCFGSVVHPTGDCVPSAVADNRRCLKLRYQQCVSKYTAVLCWADSGGLDCHAGLVLEAICHVESVQVAMQILRQFTVVFSRAAGEASCGVQQRFLSRISLCRPVTCYSSPLGPWQKCSQINVFTDSSSVSLSMQDYSNSYG